MNNDLEESQISTFNKWFCFISKEGQLVTRLVKITIPNKPESNFEGEDIQEIYDRTGNLL